MSDNDITVFTFSARGHPNVLATHRTTLEITREPALTPNGDCIIGVSASHALCDLPPEIQFKMRQTNVQITLEIRIGAFHKVIVKGEGHPGLSFESPEVMICRKSTFIDPRTLMINANIAAVDLPRSMVAHLQDAGTKINFRLLV